MTKVKRLSFYNNKSLTALYLTTDQNLDESGSLIQTEYEPIPEIYPAVSNDPNIVIPELSENRCWPKCQILIPLFPIQGHRERKTATQQQTFPQDEIILSALPIRESARPTDKSSPTFANMSSPGESSLVLVFPPLPRCAEKRNGSNNNKRLFWTTPILRRKTKSAPVEGGGGGSGQDLPIGVKRH